MTDDTVRRKQSEAARKHAQQQAEYYHSAEWRAQQEQNQAEARERLRDTPERREQQRSAYLLDVFRQQEWDAEDRADAEKVAAYAEKLAAGRRKERGIKDDG